MKTTYLIVGVLALLWYRGTQKKAVSTQLEDTSHLGGSDFIGDTWARLNGADLVAQGYPNLLGSVNADPGRIGVSTLMPNVSWNGTIQ